jgi:CubicO group peptidase (beta-lactamase class C family)
MRQGLRALLMAVVLALAPGSANAGPLEEYVQGEMNRTNVPGMAVAVAQNGRIVRAQGFGKANIELGVSVHPDTLFKTGAVGMQFTAVAVMLLVEDGKVRLDDSIRRYLPDAPRSWEPITVRQLLNHTSGLPATPAGEFRVDYTDEQLLGIIYDQELNFPAGTRWRFSYSDYIVLGFLISKVSGEYYADLLAKRVFTPLGMRTARPIDESAIVPNRADGYEMQDGEPRNAEWVSPTANSTADGSLYLSALDYVAWAAGMADRKILRPESWAEIGQPAPLASGRDYPYGFGWFLGQHAGQGTWWHSGSWQGFETFVIRYLGEELTVAVIANGDGGHPGKIARHVAAMLQPNLAQAPGMPIEDRDPGVTGQVERLLQGIAEGTGTYSDFAFVSKADFDEMMAENRALLDPLGALREMALFGREVLGDDQVYRYRARYDLGVVDVAVGLAPSGKIGQLDLTPAEQWTDPVPQ